MPECLKKLGDLVSSHFSDTHYKRSETQIEREKWLVSGCIPFSRYVLLPVALLIQICCGSLYAWSGYNLPMEAYIMGRNGSVDRAKASVTFYIAVAFFGFTAFLLGPWLERRGPFKGAMLGAILFYLGNLLTALGVYVQNFGLIYFAYGVIGGAGLGISYIAPVSPLQKWFPELRGFAGGIAVCGFGAGSIFSPYTQKALIGPTYATNGEENVGLPLTFVILGSCYFVIMGLCAFFLRMPPPNYTQAGITIEDIKGIEQLQNIKKEAFHMTLAQSLTSKEYVLMYFMFMCNELTGLLIISKIQSIVQNQLGQTADYAASINSALGGMNLAGRISVPLLSDWIKHRKPFFLLSLLCQAIFLGILKDAIIDQNKNLVLAAAFIIAYFYGSGFGIIPSFLADQFGAKNVGGTHGTILTAWATAGVVGGLTFTAVYNQQKESLTAQLGAKNALHHLYDIDFEWMLAFVCFGFILAIFIPDNIKDRKLPALPGECCRIRCLTRMMRCIIYSKKEENDEWNKYLDGMSLPSEMEILQQNKEKNSEIQMNAFGTDGNIQLPDKL